MSNDLSNLTKLARNISGSNGGYVDVGFTVNARYIYQSGVTDTVSAVSGINLD
jgi:hypothetical protein